MSALFGLHAAYSMNTSKTTAASAPAAMPATLPVDSELDEPEPVEFEPGTAEMNEDEEVRARAELLDAEVAALGAEESEVEPVDDDVRGEVQDMRVEVEEEDEGVGEEEVEEEEEDEEAAQLLSGGEATCLQAAAVYTLKLYAHRGK